jgi:hypothetical protein
MARVREGLVIYHHSKPEWTIGRELEVENLRVFRAMGDRFRAANALEWLAVFDQSLAGGRSASARGFSLQCTTSRARRGVPIRK